MKRLPDVTNQKINNAGAKALAKGDEMSEKTDWEQIYYQAQRRFYEERKVLTARIAELEAEVAELVPYRDGYHPGEVFPPENEWVWLRNCDDNIEPVQYNHITEIYWNYEGVWMPDDGDLRRWYPIGKLPEERER